MLRGWEIHNATNIYRKTSKREYTLKQRQLFYSSSNNDDAYLPPCFLLPLLISNYTLSLCYVKTRLKA